MRSSCFPHAFLIFSASLSYFCELFLLSAENNDRDGYHSAQDAYDNDDLPSETGNGIIRLDGIVVGRRGSRSGIVGETRDYRVIGEVVRVEKRDNRLLSARSY